MSGVWEATAGLLKVGKAQGFLPRSKVPMGLGDQGPGLLGLREDGAGGSGFSGLRDEGVGVQLPDLSEEVAGSSGSWGLREEGVGVQIPGSWGRRGWRG